MKEPFLCSVIQRPRQSDQDHKCLATDHCPAIKQIGDGRGRGVSHSEQAYKEVDAPTSHIGSIFCKVILKVWPLHAKFVKR